jgi:circadian clock protein KaiC
LAQRYVEIDGHLQKVLLVVKMRGSEHATDFRGYRLTADGAAMGESLSNYRAITTGMPELADIAGSVVPHG